MNNDIKLLPLRQYSVGFGYDREADTFTADCFVRDEGDTIFYRTGNVVRIYTKDACITDITVTPVDEVPE